MDFSSLPQQTIFVDWTKKSFVYRKADDRLVQVRFPVRTDMFHACCAIALAQQQSMRTEGISTWSGVTPAAFDAFAQDAKWRIRHAGFVPYWSYMKSGTKAIRVLTHITVVGGEVPADECGLAQDLFGKIPHGGHILGESEGLPNGSHRLWKIDFPEPEEDAERHAYNALRDAACRFFLPPNSSDPPGISVSRAVPYSFEEVYAAHKLFGGRKSEIDRLNRFVEENDRGYVFVTGPSGSGKTALLANWAQEIQRGPYETAVHFITSRIHSGSMRFCLSNLCKQLAAFHEEPADLPSDDWELEGRYRELLCQPLTPGRQIVLILDGLDEAPRPWQPSGAIFPANLPQGVRVVFSARSIADKNWLTDLGLELPDQQVITLNRLSVDGVRDVLAQSEVLPKKADDLPRTAERLFAISEGDAFYLQDLLKDLAQSHGDIDRIEECPIGHNAYLGAWWKNGCRSADSYAFSELLGYLALAQGPISRDVLVRLGEDGAIRGGNCRLLIENAARYLLGSESDGYQLSHPRIVAFVQQELGRELDTYRQRFADFSLRWAEHPHGAARDYALRFGPHHVLDAGRLDAAHALFTDRAFLEAKVTSGGVFELLDDFAAALRLTPDNHRTRRTLEVLDEALRRNTQFIDRHPTALFQCLWNNCWWHDHPDAAQHYQAPEEGCPQDTTPWLQAGPKVHGLLERWREGIEAAGRVWVRALRPPHRPIGGGIMVLRGHEQPVTRVGVSHDGRYVAAVASDRALRVWDSRRGEQLACPHTDVRDISWAPSDDRLLLAFGSGRLAIWTPRSSDALSTIATHDAAVSSIAWSPDGVNVASGMADGSIVLQSASTGASVACMKHTDERIVALTCTRDGRHVIVASGCAVRVCDLSTCRAVHVLEEPDGETLSALAVSSHDQRIATIARSSYLVRLWQWSPAPRQYAILPIAGHPRSVAFSPDGSDLAVGSSDGVIYLYDTVTRKERMCVRGHESDVSGVVFCPSGERIVSGSSDLSIHVSSLTRGQSACVRRDHAGRINDVVATADGSYVASADDVVRIWNGETGQEHQLVRPRALGVASSWGITCLGISCDGTRLVSGARDGALDVWDVATGGHLASLRAGGGVSSVEVYAEGRRLVAGCSDGSVRVFRTAPEQELVVLGGSQNRAICCALSPGGLMLAVGLESGEVCVVDAVRVVEHAILRGQKSCVWRVVFSHDGKKVASKADDGAVLVWDLRSGDVVSTDTCSDEEWPYPWLTEWHEAIMAEGDGWELAAWEVASGRRFGRRRRPGERSLCAELRSAECGVRFDDCKEEIAWIPGHYHRFESVGHGGRKWIGIGGDRYVDLFVVEGLNHGDIATGTVRRHAQGGPAALPAPEAPTFCVDTGELRSAVERGDSFCSDSETDALCAVCNQPLAFPALRMKGGPLCATCVELELEAIAFAENVSAWSNEMILTALKLESGITDKLTILWRFQELLGRCVGKSDEWRREALLALAANLGFEREHPLAILVRVLAIQACAAFGAEMLSLLRASDRRDPWQFLVNAGFTAIRISTYPNEARTVVERAAKDPRPQVRRYVPSMLDEQASTWARNIVEELAADVDASVRNEAQSLLASWGAAE